MNFQSNKIETSGICHIGPVREENQDTICLIEKMGENCGSLFAVADGMGGYDNGKLASTLAIESLYSTFSDDNRSPEKRLTHSFESANFTVFKTAQKLETGRMGTTLTAVYLEGNTLTVVHIGDSRVYLVRGNNVECLTRDHTVVGDLVRMKVLTPEKLRTHPQRSILTRAIGLSPFVHPDITKHEMREGDDIILCSDGLWSVINDEELPAICQTSNGITIVVNRLLNLAIKRGTDDNISAIGVHIHTLVKKSLPSKPNTWHRNWLDGR